MAYRITTTLNLVYHYTDLYLSQRSVLNLSTTLKLCNEAFSVTLIALVLMRNVKTLRFRRAPLGLLHGL